LNRTLLPPHISIFGICELQIDQEESTNDDDCQG
jgi:hypothetical protein